MVVTSTLNMQDHSDAVIDRLTAFGVTTGVTLPVYLAGEVPVTPAYPYVVVWPWQRQDTGERRLSDDSTSRPIRILTEFFADSPNSCFAVESHLDAALRDHRLVVAGVLCTPMHYEPARGVAKDPSVDDLFSGMSGWTFVSTLQ